MKCLLLVALLMGCAAPPGAGTYQPSKVPPQIVVESPVPAELTANPQPLSDEHEAFVQDWINRFSLNHWDIEILYGDIKEFHLLGVTFWTIEFSGQSAQIRILNPADTSWETMNIEIEEVFIHELLHLRIAQLRYTCRFYPEQIFYVDEDLTYDLARLLWERWYAGE